MELFEFSLYVGNVILSDCFIEEGAISVRIPVSETSAI